MPSQAKWKNKYPISALIGNWGICPTERTGIPELKIKTQNDSAPD